MMNFTALYHSLIRYTYKAVCSTANNHYVFARLPFQSRMCAHCMVLDMAPQLITKRQGP